MRRPPDPDYPGQSRFLTTCPGKNHSSTNQDAHLSRFWLGVPGMSRFAHLCLRMVAKNQVRFYLYIRKNRWRPGLYPGPLLGSSRRSHGNPSRTPDGSAFGALALYDSRLWRSSRVAVPKCQAGHVKRPHIDTWLVKFNCMVCRQ